jgi:hypothetical protein
MRLGQPLPRTARQGHAMHRFFKKGGRPRCNATDHPKPEYHDEWLMIS